MARFVVPTIYKFTNTWASGTNCSETLYTLHILKLLPSNSYAKYEMSFMLCASYSRDYITQISVESLPRSRIPFVYEFHCFNKLNVVLLIRNWLKGLLSAGQNVWTNNELTVCSTFMYVLMVVKLRLTWLIVFSSFGIGINYISIKMMYLPASNVFWP